MTTTTQFRHSFVAGSDPVKRGLLRRRRGLGIPLADVGGLSWAVRRTTLVRVLLAAALVGVLALTVSAASRLEVRQGGFLPSGTSGVVVLDLSTSIEPQAYRRVRNVLAELVEADQPVGLVYFSDTAYEAVPPGTRGVDLQPLLRYFTPVRQRPLRDGRRPFPVFDPRTPWTGTFRGGTRISTGLRLAKQMLERDGIERGAVLLVSDLDDSAFDVARLTETLVDYKRDSLRLRIVPVFADTVDRRYFWRILGPGAFVEWDEMSTSVRRRAGGSPIGEPPTWLLVTGGLLLVLLAANEYWSGRLRLRGRAT